MKHLLRLGSFSAALLLAASAAAIPPATQLERTTHQVGTPAKPSVGFRYDVTKAQALAQIKLVGAWDVTMQSTSCGDPDAGLDAGWDACTKGGIIEVQSGPGMAIVASDNTQEAIGLWNLDDTLNGVSYPQNIALAFDYLATHPGYDAWELTGDPGPDYYSVYNCGWGVRAVMLYEATTGDMSHHAYGETCAQHIATNAPSLVSDNAELIDVGPAGWAASGLWLWGNTYSADASMKATAATIGAGVKAWIESMPSRLTFEQWAMTGGAPYYGVIGSYMKENPGELDAWVAQFAPMLGGWIDESTPADPNDWTDWRNAWNNWNMLAQFTSADVLHGDAGAMNEASATNILGLLTAQASATTGAIAGSQQRPSTEAESWITAYMVYFGLLQVVGDPLIGAFDAGLPDAAPAGADAAPADASSSDAMGPTTKPKDAGAPILPTVDASSTDHAPASSSGCGCVVVGRAGGESQRPLFLVGAAIVLAARRRRRGGRV